MVWGAHTQGILPLKGSVEEVEKNFARLFGSLSNVKATLCMDVKTLWKKVMKLGRDDPRRIYHAFKVGLALTIVAIFYFMNPLYDGMGGNAMWAVMTVVVVFEYTVGGTLCKGLNRAFGTLLAGSLGLGVHYIASLSGDKGEPMILGVFMFLLASASTFSRFFPGIKAKYDYGVLIFILTFSLVSVSGYRVEKLFKMACERMSTIAIGGALCVIVSVLICPVWAGGDLHDLTVKNLQILADSLEGCVEEYFNEKEEEDGLKSNDTSSIRGYKTVLDSKAKEELLANLAKWEPAHGQFVFLHPWKQYLKIGTAIRGCAYCVESLNASIHSQHKAPKALCQQLKEPYLKLSSLSSLVLRQVSTDIDTMKRTSSIEPLIDSINDGITELYTALKSLPQAHPHFLNAHEGTTAAGPALMDLLTLTTMASILIELVSRMDIIISTVDELSVLAGFENHMPTNITAKSQHSATVSPICDKRGPHAIVEINRS